MRSVETLYHDAMDECWSSDLSNKGKGRFVK
jgi:hypothetical protein